VIALAGERRSLVGATVLAAIVSVGIAFAGTAGALSIATLLVASSVGHGALTVLGANVLARRRALLVLFGLALAGPVGSRIFLPVLENTFEPEVTSVVPMSAAMTCVAAIVVIGVVRAGAGVRDDASEPLVPLVPLVPLALREYMRVLGITLALIAPLWAIRSIATEALSPMVTAAMPAQEAGAGLGDMIMRGMLPRRYLDLAGGAGVIVALLGGLVAIAVHGGRGQQVRTERVGLAIALALGAVSALAATVTLGTSLAWPLVMMAAIRGAASLAIPFVSLRLYAGVPLRFAGIAMFALAIASWPIDLVGRLVADATSPRAALVAAALASAVSAVSLAFRPGLPAKT
jgi:hypothetical protein